MAFVYFVRSMQNIRQACLISSSGICQHINTPQPQKEHHNNQKAHKRSQESSLFHYTMATEMLTDLAQDQSPTKAPGKDFAGERSSPADLEVRPSREKTNEDAPVANTVQSVALSQTDKSSFSAASRRNSGSRPDRQRRRVLDRGFEEFEYHFHKTPLNLFESYFAESEQHHCTFASRNNPGRLLSASPEAAEPDSSDHNDDDDHDDDATVVTRDNAASTNLKVEKRVRFSITDQSRPPHLVSMSSCDDKTDDIANRGLIADNLQSANPGNCDVEDDIEENAENVNLKKAAYLPDDDLFRDRWFADPWDRPPGQLWTKEIQNQHNLCAAIKERGFTGARTAWLLNQLWKRKGYLFPFNKRFSLRKPGQSQAEYVSALKRRKEEEQSCKNQVIEYDEERALEGCRWALGLYEKVYGPDWPDNAVKSKPSTADAILEEDEIDGVNKEKEPTPKRRKTDQPTSTPEPCTEENVRAVDHGITIPPDGERASLQEIQQRNRDFKTYKAEVLESARNRREEETIQDFMRSAGNRKFSSG